MGSIEFCKLNLAFEGDLRAGQVPLEICKVIEIGRFRSFDLFQAGRIIGFRSGTWRIVSGTCFEIGFKCSSFCFGFKGNINFKFPWLERSSMGNSPFIVFG